MLNSFQSCFALLTSLALLQAAVAKLQVLTLAAKLVVLCPVKEIQLLSHYALSLARYDANWDVRDRGRFLNGLLRGVRQTVSGENSMATHETDEDEEEDLGGVTLRREQVKLVLLGTRTMSVNLQGFKGELPVMTASLDSTNG